ncbi:unnamed protein product [Lactuca saligna]|uniref:Uncharacterized protein n=1 Tax=Lactuca saligna TaxID=75948 RepID=A0AA35Y9I4_LACSI|nr:unnamed protein product [Lactuca saligna]
MYELFHKARHVPRPQPEMVDLPDEHPNWMDITDPNELQRVSIQLAEDPYLLENAPATSKDLSEEEDLSEDEENNDIEEVEVSYA